MTVWLLPLVPALAPGSTAAQIDAACRQPGPKAVTRAFNTLHAEGALRCFGAARAQLAAARASEQTAADLGRPVMSTVEIEVRTALPASAFIPSSRAAGAASAGSVAAAPYFAMAAAITVQMLLAAAAVQGKLPLGAGRAALRAVESWQLAPLLLGIASAFALAATVADVALLQGRAAGSLTAYFLAGAERRRPPRSIRSHFASGCLISRVLGQAVGGRARGGALPPRPPPRMRPRRRPIRPARSDSRPQV